jgi:hypothetical protein
MALTNIRIWLGFPIFHISLASCAHEWEKCLMDADVVSDIIHERCCVCKCEILFAMYNGGTCRWVICIRVYSHMSVRVHVSGVCVTDAQALQKQVLLLFKIDAD